METSTLSSMQQGSCEEFAPDVQFKLMAVRMFLIAASWMAVFMERMHQEQRNQATNYGTEFDVFSCPKE